MYPRQLLTSKNLRLFCAAVLMLSLSGCALFGSGKKPAVVKRERIFNAPFEDVERAVKQAMVRYPAKIDNPDAGIFETDWVKDDVRFVPAHKQEDYSDGYQYRLIVRMVRGRAPKPATKVVISKQAVLNRDFFSEPEPVASDGSEEDVLLYRIGRELALERAIRRFQEKQNKAAREN